MQPIVALLLARLLTQEDFGMVAMCFVVISFLRVFSDGGLGQAIIQSEDVSIVDFAFSVQMPTGIGMAIVLVLCAPAAAAFYGQTDLVLPIRVLSLTFLISPFVDIPILLSQRRLDFRVSFVRSIIAPIVAGVVSVSLAITGLRYWALIWGSVAGQLTSAAVLPLLTAWRPRLHLSPVGRNAQVTFGLHMLAQAALRWLRNSIAKLALGKTRGTAQLGYYELAQQAANMPYNCVGGALHRLAFPVFSREHREGRELGPIFTMFVGRLALFTVPLGLFLGWTATDAIAVFLGTRWLPMHGVFLACLVAANVAAIVNLNAAVYKAMNRPEILTSFMSVTVVITAPIYAIAAMYGLATLSVVIAVLPLLAGPINSYLVCRLLGLSCRRYWMLLIRNSAIPVVALSGAALLVRGLDASPAHSLALNAIALGTVMVVNTCLLEPTLARRAAGRFLGQVQAVFSAT